MNKPASKEPSMDEILSSIRQIIADDDAAVAPRKPAVPPVAAVPQPAAPPAPRPTPPVSPIAPPPRFGAPRPAEAADEPLALTPAQMVRAEPVAPPQVPSFAAATAPEDDDDADDSMMAAEAELVDPEDVAFESDDPEPYQPAPEPEPEPPPAPRVEARPFVRPEPPVPPVQAEAPPYSPPPRPGPSVGRASPMPDPTLSRDMAEELLEPATNAAVKHNFARLSGLSMANSGVTLDALMREMLRPMLKEWLDENLPAVVERMVEKEISRISRGGD